MKGTLVHFYGVCPVPAPCRAFHRSKLISNSPWPRSHKLLLFHLQKRKEARVKGPVSDGTGRGGMGTSVPWLQSTSCHPAGRTSRLSGRHPQGTDRRLGGDSSSPQEEPPSLSGFLLLPVTLSKALKTGGLSLWQRALETIMINPPLGQRPCIKSKVPCPLHMLPLSLVLTRSELHLLWPVTRELHHRKLSTPMASMDPKLTEPWPSTHMSLLVLS